MTSGTDYLEREIKFAADAGFELPDLRKVVGSTQRLPEQSLRTAYFDTPDYRLWQRGITLRHRKGEDAHTGRWTLKLPEEATGASIDRTELSWAGEQQEIPGEAVRILVGIVRRAILGRIVVLESTRRRLVLRDPEGVALGELDDDIVKVAKGTTKGREFRQIELELSGQADPDEHTVAAVLKKIRRAGARPEREQKFAKSINLQQPTAKDGGHVGRHATVSDLVRLSIGNAVNRLLAHDYLLRLEPSDPPAHSIHQARVATRRLRSDLKTFRPLLDPIWLRHTTDELKWLGDRLGHVRDADVLARRFDAEAQTMPANAGYEGLRERLAKKRLRSTEELADAMNSDRYLSLLERLSAAAQVPPIYGYKHKHVRRSGDAAQELLPDLVGRQWKTLRRRVRKAGRNPSDKQLHRIRIASKQLRYAAEASSPVVGKSAGRTARRAEALQTILGEHHDAVAAEQWLERAARNGSGCDGYAAGLLTATERRRQTRLRHKWHGVWAEVATKKSTGWLR